MQEPPPAILLRNGLPRVERARKEYICFGHRACAVRRNCYGYRARPRIERKVGVVVLNGDSFYQVVEKRSNILKVCELKVACDSDIIATPTLYAL